MLFFKDDQDVEEWLEPLDYEEFWKETALFNLELPSRDHCDECIAKQNVPRETILSVVKGMTRSQIVLQQKLSPRLNVPWMATH